MGETNIQIDAHVHSDGSAKHIRSLLKVGDKIGTEPRLINLKYVLIKGIKR